MSDINTTDARELFAKTTQGEYCVVFTDDDKSMNAVYVGTVNRGSSHDNQKGMDGRRGGEVENAEWIAYAHNNWQAMLDTIERQRAELGEYWRAACDIESEDDVVSAKGLADLHEIRMGNSWSQIGPSVAEMLVRQRDELAKEVERLKHFEKCVADAMQWEPMTCKQMIDLAIRGSQIKCVEMID